MFNQNHLALRLIRLKAPAEWRNKRDGFSFLFPTGGSGHYASNTVTRRLTPGDVLVWNSDTDGKLSVSNGGEIVFWSFFLLPEHLFPLFTCSEIPLLQEIAQRLKTPKLIVASDPLAIECHGLIEDVPTHFNLSHRSQLLRVAAAVLSAEFATAHRQAAGFVRVEDHLVQVFEKLSVTELLSLSVAELAAKFSCSRRHLNRLFHHYFGFSVGGLRMEMRLLKAISLLRDPNMKIIHVAEQCGFNHLGLFNTCFKRRFSTSPGQWRKLAVQAESSAAGGAIKGWVCPLRSHGMCPLPPNAGLTGPAVLAKPPLTRPGVQHLLGDRGLCKGVRQMFPEQLTVCEKGCRGYSGPSPAP